MYFLNMLHNIATSRFTTFTQVFHNLVQNITLYIPIYSHLKNCGYSGINHNATSTKLSRICGGSDQKLNTYFFYIEKSKNTVKLIIVNINR